MFDDELLSMINTNCDLKVRDITSKIYLYIRTKYTEQMISNSALNNFRQVLLTCKETVRGLDGN